MKNRFLSVAVLLLFSFAVFAEEKIYLFKSDIEVLESSDIIVTETIKIKSEQLDFQRGLFRVIPNYYKTKSGLKFKVDYDVLEVLKDGFKEDYHIKNKNGASYIYIGNKDRFIEKGDHSYTLKYKTNKQIGYFEDFDELYWNVNGNDWNFVIDKIEAKITLPENGKLDDIVAYTGMYGESGDAYTFKKVDNNQVQFTSLKAFDYNENMTVAVSWQKGVVHQPSKQESFMEVLKDNLFILVGVLGTLLAFLLHLFNWKRVGVDPPEGTIIPLFKPKNALSPSSMRYILKMKSDEKAFTAAIISMATKGLIKIEKKKNTYTLLKTTNSDTKLLSKSEESIYNSFLGSSNSFKLSTEKHVAIRAAMQTFEKNEEDIHQETYFKLNRKHLIGGVILSLLTIGLMVVTIGMDLSISSFSPIVPILFFAFFMFRNMSNNGKNLVGILIGISFFGFFFFMTSIGSLGLTSIQIIAIVIVVIVLLIINLLFAYLMKAPTLFGRKEMDHIEGFKMYLKTAEESRLDHMNPPDKTPELFEKYLPFAIALDCENQWGDKFKNVLSKAIQSGEYSSPTWYVGNGRAFSPKNFTNDIGDKFTNSVSNASMSPNERGTGGNFSGGSGGGGFSGGGGGGGGGGGW